MKRNRRRIIVGREDKSALNIYNQMICWYEDFVKTENGKECIAEFNKILPDYVWMSDVKKIDFYLWSKREG